ncbi:MAG: type II toxin-antitoxin system HicB family antitoxin [Candidatus Omnitrophota bacterium]|nr:MAG: type II toxin-antitoxin system HicB family antitoxin [Candidatus Omnitrophota bacterium]
MKQTFTVIVEQGLDGFLVSDVVELSGCHTQARTYDELLVRTREAIELYLEEKPEVLTTFVGLAQIQV